MNDVNVITVVGRLTKDADLKYTSGGSPVSNFSIAVNHRVKVGDQWQDVANFFDVAFFGKLAEALKPSLIKGKQVCVKGSLRQNRWEQNGEKKSRVIIHADELQLFGGGQHTQNNGSEKQSSYTAKPSVPEYANDDLAFPEDVPY